MKTEIDEERRIIKVKDDNENVKIRICLMDDYAIWIGESGDEVIINENSDPHLYNNLMWLLSNTYDFKGSSGFQADGKIEFLSDERVQVKGNEERMSKISSISLELDEENNQIRIRFKNSYLDREENKEEDKNKDRRVFFLKNIYDITNEENKSTLEEDMIKAINRTFHDMSLQSKKSA